MIDEFALIQIAQRRRALEEAMAQADKKLAVQQKYHEREARNYGDTDSMYAREKFRKHCAESENISDLRGDIERLREVCRSDMVLMEEELRKAGAVK